MELATLELEKLAPADYNPRMDLKPGDHDYDRLKHSILTFGMVEPIIWNRKTGRVVGGHQRLKVMRDLGHTDAQVVVVDLDDNQERALNTALNRIHGDWDYPKLTEMLKGLDGNIDLKLTGFTDDELESLLARFTPADALTDPDLVPENVPTVCQTGDLWQLGPHRLLCGDSTNHETIARLMGQERAAMIFTDPPWNVAIGKDSNPRHRQREGLENDDLGADFPAFLNGFITATIPYLEGDIYCVMGSREWPAIDQALRDGGLHWSDVIVWVKDSFVLGRGKYHKRFEPIWYGWRTDKTSSYCADRSQDDVWEVKRPKVSEDHPTMKPVELVIKAIANSSKPGDLVLEPFGGAGSTLIACEREGRRCYAVEISPKYCDVIIERYKLHTGTEPTKL